MTAAVVLKFSCCACVIRLFPNKLSYVVNLSDFPRTIMWLIMFGLEKENDFCF